jgi:hypothetical protein
MFSYLTTIIYPQKEAKFKKRSRIEKSEEKKNLWRRADTDRLAWTVAELI